MDEVQIWQLYFTFFHWLFVCVLEKNSSDKPTWPQISINEAFWENCSSALLWLMSLNKFELNEHLFSLIYLLFHFISEPHNQMAISEAWITEQLMVDTCMV